MASRDPPDLPDFGLLKRLARDQLVYLLEQLPGKKDLFLEPDLMSPLDRIANVSILKQHDVHKLYKLEKKPARSSSDQLCFLLRPRLASVRLVAEMINADKVAGRARRYKIIFSPQKFYACELVLEEEGIYGDVTWDEWSFSLLPLDNDIISMELPEFFRDYFLEADQRWINTVAQALQLMNSLYGPFTETYGIGRCAKMVHELWRDLVEESEEANVDRKPEIGQVFLIDRGKKYFPPSDLTIFLVSADIGACESIMKKKTRQDFQELLKTEHALLEGFDIRESISFIEEHIDRQVTPIESLRILCLLSITENGLSPKDYRSLKTQYLQSYGPEHLLTFHNLKHLGLLTEQVSGETLTAMENKVSKLVTDKAAEKLSDAFSSLARKNNFRAISKKLGLIPRGSGDYDLKVPLDMAYVFSGAYVPLSCKIMEQVLERRSWLGLEEVAKLLGGHEFVTAAEEPRPPASQQVILAVFLGGCTFSEVAALRFLGRERGLRFIILTTAITNSARLLESTMETRM
ncbi:LOW QUALITY PROTEIN: vacuolar protein sorting-associated protein 33B [Erythrolamprus reginae]|uniref:LOW QUALITY PROTEIN: vacuolar protein sorting-associated protein 33B n=1 Tax=Erythrolamprus reginae TaxID=121349 RepID=UPI00396CC815